jgi:molybdate transport system substrate-binding protein
MPEFAPSKQDYRNPPSTSLRDKQRSVTAHDFSRAEEAAKRGRALAPATLAYRNTKHPAPSQCFVTGHDFSRAETAAKSGRALAPATARFPQTPFSEPLLAATLSFLKSLFHPSRRRLLAFAALLFLTSALSAQTIRIAAAADLEPVLPPILQQFELSTGIHADATYHASAALTTQIQNGAPFDVFLSANLDYPQKLIAAHLAQGLDEATSGSPIVYATGTLVLWTRNGSPLGPPSLALLRNPALKRLSIANPDRAPYGKAAVLALQKLGLYDALKPRLAVAENIAQAAQFVDSGNADAGLISLTAAKTPRLSSAGSYIEIPSADYPPIQQGAVFISNSTQQAAAKKFLVYLMSAPIQHQLLKYGLKPGRPLTTP